PRKAETFDGLDGAVDSGPGQDLGVDEVPARTADLPQAVVRVVPVAFEELQQCQLQIPGVLRGGQPSVSGQVQPVEHLPPGVELVLPGGGVTDPDRGGSFVTGQPVQGELRDPAAAVEPVHDPQVGRVAGGRAQQPVPPGLRLLDVTGAHQCLQGERGVAQPAVAV